MAFWEGPFQAMDPLTYSAIIQLQLEDTQELVATAKGKQREGTVTDAELALQMYTEDLMNTNAALSDRKMAQSMAMAVLRDGQLIHRAHQQEDQIARDREMATDLQTDAPAPLNIDPTSRKEMSQEHDPWTDPELLEKAAALYMHEPCSEFASLPSLILDSDSDDATVAESSAWAASRTTKDRPKLGHCVACGEDEDFFDVARVPCKDKHEYCRDCLAQLFELSMTDESLFPPRCDNEPIPLSLVRIFLPSDLAKRFEAQYVELSTKNRIYCHDPRCSAFIPKEAVGEDTDIGTCPKCDKTTCAICKAPSHTGDCPEDTGLQQLVSAANTEQWQRCYDCKRFVELKTGCNHMTCRCSAQFCYICGQRWKTCRCQLWEEPRLYARAAQLVDRNANRGRRLFEPQRVPHAQPASRRPSIAASEATEAGPAVPRRAVAQRVASGASSAWQSDFSDNSEWEGDWLQDDADEGPAPMPARAKPPPAADLPGSGISTANRLRDLRIAEAVADLRVNHECNHDKWRWVGGRHQCEECHHVLRQYIFECKQCHLQACNRCRRNRL